jgi:lia operon protein LiaF
MARFRPPLSLPALVLIALGVLFLAAELTGLDAGPVVTTWWPLFLIGAGVTNLANRRSGASGMVLVLLGSVFLAANFGYLPWRTIVSLWPLALIGAGIAMLARPNRGDRPL